MLRTLLAFVFTGLLSLSADTLVKRTQLMMGTYVSISLEKENLSASNLAFDRIRKVEKALSSYDKEAEIYKLNHLNVTSISADTYEALALSKQYYKQTHGYFDITIGSITKGLFHFGENTTLPVSSDLQKARINFQGLRFTDTQAYTDKGITIDLGGMGKGFGVDKAVEVLKEQGVDRGVVSLSGDIRCLHKCEMSIQHPFHEGLLASFKMSEKGMGISTSGNYRRFVKSSKYNHLINPKTHQSQRVFASVTLMSNSLSNSDLDAYATAASVMPYHKAIDFLEDIPKLAYLLVTTSRKIHMNDQFRYLTSELKLSELSDSKKKEYIKVKPSKTQNSKKPRP